MRRAARTDGNHSQVRAALRSVGAVVVDTSAVGDGFPDMIACHAGRILPVEVKDGTKPPSARRLTEAQVELHRRLALVGVTVHVVESVAEALALVGSRRVA